MRIWPETGWRGAGRRRARRGRPGRGRRRAVGAGLRVALAALGLAGAWHAAHASGAPPGDPRRAAASVSIKNFDFTPQVMTLAAGESVRWINADVAQHQITSGVVEGGRPRPDGRISSPLLVRGEAFAASFEAPGEYPYYCGVHPFMRGTVVVR